MYKTEYLLSLTLNAAEELEKGDKAMKDLFGFNLDQLAGRIDPTKPQNNLAGASGSQTVTVQILSPYPDETANWVAPPKLAPKDIRLKSMQKNNKNP